MPAFYSWLLLPAGFAAIAIWGGIGYYDDYFATDTTAVLNIVSTIVLLGVTVHKGWQYLRNWSFGKLLIYGLPALICISFLGNYSFVVFLAIPALFLYGWDASREDASQNVPLVYNLYLPGSWKRFLYDRNPEISYLSSVWQMEILEEKTSGRMLNWLAILRR